MSATAQSLQNERRAHTLVEDSLPFLVGFFDGIGHVLRWTRRTEERPEERDSGHRQIDGSGADERRDGFLRGLYSRGCVCKGVEDADKTWK